VICLSQDAKVADQAKAEGITKSIVAMRHAAALAPRAIVVVGNAPTALLEVQRLIIAGKWTPSVLVAMPVGFVAAEESKHALEHGHAGDVPYITCLGRKGGTPAAVAAVNALLRLLGGE
jgi:precorrin-8X/cobalt-precorrin-8 methylmutase